MINMWLFSAEWLAAGMMIGETLRWIEAWPAEQRLLPAQTHAT